MKAKDFLQQAYRLELQIESHSNELERLRSMTALLLSKKPDECDNADSDNSRKECLEEVRALEKKIYEEILRFIALKKRIHDTIGKVDDIDLQMVLRYRYLHHMTWEEIGDNLYIDESTARRWHRKALDMIEIPPDMADEE